MQVLELPLPEACSNDDAICGEDPNKYPIGAIDVRPTIIKQRNYSIGTTPMPY